MVSLRIARLLKLPHALKIVEMVFGFIIIFMARFGEGGYPISWGNDTDGDIFGIMVCYGYFYILLIQIFGLMCGDNAPVESTLFALIGFVFWLSIGSMKIYDHQGQSVHLALGAMAIINSGAYAAEGVLHGLNLRIDDEE